MTFENVGVYNMENALRGMRNPMNGAALSDTHESFSRAGEAVVGEKDHDLAMRLIKAGEPHRKFLRQIFVSVDICKFPVEWLVEFDTYQIGTTKDCASTMHKITSRPLTKDDFATPETEIEKWHLGDTIETVNLLREQYLAHKKTGETDEAEKYFRGIKRTLNGGYLYERMTWTANYEVLRNIYAWRRNHRLPEWRQFCTEFIEKLPYAEFITEGLKDNV